MNDEYVKALQQAREEIVKSRRATAQLLMKPYDPEATPKHRETFIEIQRLIDKIDRAIDDEQDIYRAIDDEEEE
jgi:hypothetical protein